MLKALKKIFSANAFFYISLIMGVFCYLAYYIMQINFSNVSVQSVVLITLRIGCFVGLFQSYVKHKKNAMKALLGALLMAQVINAILMSNYLYSTFDKICLPLNIILSAILFLNHICINWSSKSSPVKVFVSQIVGILILVNLVVWMISWLVSTTTAMDVIMFMANVLALAGITFSVVCVETKLQVFREMRTEAGWTPEKGYPEGYDRTQNYMDED